LKVVYYNSFYCSSILVVFCKAVTIPELEGRSPPSANNLALLTKSSYLSFKIVIKKGKNTKNYVNSKLDGFSAH